MNKDLASSGRTRTLSTELASTLAARIRGGDYPVGSKLPKEADIMEEFGVSRTVVREAISSLQAMKLAETRHGIGTFVMQADEGEPFRFRPEQMATLRDTIALMELRIAIETEAAAIAAVRRTEENLSRMQAALDDFMRAVQAGQNAVITDFQFHQEIAQATQNSHFTEALKMLGSGVIPRARLTPASLDGASQSQYLRRVHHEHESIFHAIRDQDVDAARAAIRTHLANSRERLRKSDTGAP
jgi:DNA-binding FadR family transcriptional regulator